MHVRRTSGGAYRAADYRRSCRTGCVSVGHNNRSRETRKAEMRISWKERKTQIQPASVHKWVTASLYSFIALTFILFLSLIRQSVAFVASSVFLSLTHTHRNVPSDSPSTHTPPIGADSAGNSRGWLIWPTGAFSTSPSVHSFSSHVTSH